MGMIMNKVEAAKVFEMVKALAAKLNLVVWTAVEPGEAAAKRRAAEKSR
jgi:hypothetical protein